MNLKSIFSVAPLFLAALIMAFAGAAGAVEKINEISSSVVTATTATITGRVSIALKGDEPEVLISLSGKFRHETTADEVDATLVKYPPGVASSGPLKLVLGETATFEVSGEFVKPGTYETFIEVSGKSGKTRFPVRVTRTAKAVNADLLLEPKPLHVDLSVIEFVTSASYPIQLTARNASNEPVEIDMPIVGQLLSGTADAKVQPATTDEPKVADSTCIGALAANQSCVFAVTLPPGLAPGSYSIDVIAPGKGGGQSVRTVNINIRASAWLAGIVIAIGVLLGAAVTDWRTARPIAVQRIESARLREAAQALEQTTKHAALRRRATRLTSELTALDTEILAGVDTLAKVAEYKSWIELLTRADGMLTPATQATQPENRVVETLSLLVQRLSVTLDAVEWNRTAVAGAVETLGAELSDFDLLYQAARRYDVATEKLTPAVNYLGVVGATPDWRAALDLREGAFTPIEPGGDGKQAASRAKALNDAVTKLESIPATLKPAVLQKLDGEIAGALQAPPSAAAKTELEELEKEVKALNSSNLTDTETLAAAMQLADRLAVITNNGAAADLPQVTKLLGADSGLIFTWPSGVFQPSPGASSDVLRQSLRSWDWITNIIALAGIAGAGVLVLWITNATWGSVQDIVLALLAGAGTRLSIGKIGQQ
jgi:hypothetical protein